MANTRRTATTAERMLQAMAEAQKKQADLVRETGLNKGTISRYLSSEVEPRRDAVNKLAIALDVSEMWLYGYDVPKARTAEQKKNDEIVGLVAQLRKDPEFFNVVSDLAELPAGEYASIKRIMKDPELFGVVSELAELPAEEYASVKQIISSLRKK